MSANGMEASAPSTDGVADALPVRVSVDGGVGHIVLARPAAGNPITNVVIEQFASAVRELDRRPDVRAVLVRAEGPNFTVGGDLNYMLERVGTLSDEFAAHVPAYSALLGDLLGVGVPVVCAVQGAVAGGGLGLLWCADVVIAADDLKLTTAFVRLGLSGDGGSTWMLPRALGHRGAFRMMASSSVIDAATALDRGLVDVVVPASELSATGAAEAAELAAGPTVALRHLKALLRRAPDNTLAQQLAEERDAMIDCGHSADVLEGIQATLQNRPPRFSGR